MCHPPIVISRGPSRSAARRSELEKILLTLGARRSPLWLKIEADLRERCGATLLRLFSSQNFSAVLFAQGGRVYAVSGLQGSASRLANVAASYSSSSRSSKYSMSLMTAAGFGKFRSGSCFHRQTVSRVTP